MAEMRAEGDRWIGWKTEPWSAEEIAAFGKWWNEALTAHSKGRRAKPMPARLASDADQTRTIEACKEKFVNIFNFQTGRPPCLPPTGILVSLSLLLDLKAQIERDAVELESMPVAWEKLTALLKEHGL